MVHSVKANGADIPALGLGTWDLRGDVCERQVAAALELGYRHIDTAAMYDNEAEVGAGIRAGSVSRGDIFLTTKVWPDDAADGDCQRSVEASLNRLGLDYVDLVLLHWPNPQIPLPETMAALADVKRRGLARHVGVSNFTDQACCVRPSPAAMNRLSPIRSNIIPIWINPPCLPNAADWMSRSQLIRRLPRGASLPSPC